MAEPIKAQPNIRPERGITGEVIPVGGIVAGSIIGSRFGTPGRVVGAGAGGVVGETIQQTIEKITGERPSYDFGQIAATGVSAATIEATAPAVIRAGKRIISPAVEAVRPTLAKWMGALSGYPKEIVAKALERGSEVVKSIKIGERSVNDIVVRSVGKVNALARATVKATKNALGLLAKQEQATIGQHMQAGKFVESVAANLRKAHNIGVTIGERAGEGAVETARLFKPSRIVSGSETKAIQEAWQAIRTIATNSKIPHVDAVLERLIVLKTKTPVGTPTGPETRAIINEMMDGVLGFVKSTYPSYSKFLEQNLQKRILIKEAQELLGSNARPSPAEVSKIAGRLFQLYNTGRLAAREGIEKVGKEVGEDITGAVAGAIMKIDDAFSFRARSLGARGAMEKLIEAIPRKAVDAYVETGKLTGELLNSKAAGLISKAIGVTRKAAGQLIGQILLHKD